MKIQNPFDLRGTINDMLSKSKVSAYSVYTFNTEGYGSDVFTDNSRGLALVGKRREEAQEYGGVFVSIDYLPEYNGLKDVLIERYDDQPPWFVNVFARDDEGVVYRLNVQEHVKYEDSLEWKKMMNSSCYQKYADFSACTKTPLQVDLAKSKNQLNKVGSSDINME